MWNPILADELEAEARASIYDIANELLAKDTSSLLAFEMCEHALLYAYLGLDNSREAWHDKSLHCLNQAINTLFVTPTFRNDLYGGLAGIGWMMQHVLSILSTVGGTIDEQGSEDDDFLFEVDERILSAGETINRNYDLISGHVGFGIYWLERLPRPKAVIGVRQTLIALEHLSTNTPLGIAWLTPPSLVPPTQVAVAPSGYYNLGVAHGIPGVIGFLAQAACLDLYEDISSKASDLLAGAMRWLIAQEKSPNSISRYGHWMIPGQDSGNTRLSWCYGDLGIAAVLQFVAHCAKNLSWAVEAKRLTDRCVLRDLDPSVLDASLCHGALGNAHIYNRAYHAYHDDVYRLAALKWTQKSLSLRKSGVGIAGHYAWRENSFPHECLDTSFLTGAVGVGLALLAAIAPIEPNWDRMMLLSGAQPLSG